MLCLVVPTIAHVWNYMLRVDDTHKDDADRERGDSDNPNDQSDNMHLMIKCFPHFPVSFSVSE